MGYQGVKYRKQLEIAGDTHALLGVDEAIKKVKQMASVDASRSYKNGKKRKAKSQTVNIVLHLGIDPRQADQLIRGAMSLPKGIGKSRRVIAFCDGADAEAARAAGAVEAGTDELVQKIEKGWTDFDVAVAHPSLMGKVGRLGRVLGPQGKMPTPKAGTVTPDVVTAVKEFGAGRLEFRNDPGGNVHLPVGRTDFADGDLKENIEAVIAQITRMKPHTAKGLYMKRVCLSGAQTPGVTINPGV
jgi:large subunit ribosomal protein L1